MAPTAPPSFRDQALPLAGRTDSISVYKFNDLIARQAIAGAPQFILVQADPNRGGSGPGKCCWLTALPAWHLSSRFILGLPLEIGSGGSPDGNLNLVEIASGAAYGPVQPTRLGSWEDVMGVVRETAIGEIDQVFRSKPVSYQFGDTGLLRAFWNLISRESSSVPKRRDEKMNPHRILFGERRATLSRRSEFPDWLDEKLSTKHPVLIAGTRKKHVLAIQLRRPFDPMTGGLSRSRLGPEDILNIDPFINPLYLAAEQTSDRLARLLSAPPPQTSEGKEDAAFMDWLRKGYILSGKRAYRNFSIQNWGERDGKLCISVCLSMGRKPFLQQTLSESVFIYWDLRNYPVTVFAYLLVGNDTKTDVVNCDTLVECHHPSICRHAFVRRLQEAGPPHYGTVCTESTRHRILRLLSKDKVFDPAEFLVAKLRSAARILRYGLRRRDMGISQHNQFGKVPETEFQAVVRGYEEARRFAEQARAEIIYFDR